MANIILTNDIITITDAKITAQSTASGFAKANIFNHGTLKRRWRMNSLTKSAVNPVINLDMASARTLTAIVLYDVNFDKVNILGHASDLTTDWTTATFDSGAISISQDAQTGRYDVYIPLTAFNYRYLAIIAPVAASAVGSYTTKWEIGNVVLLDSGSTLSKNMAFGYSRGAEQAFAELKLASGHIERTTLGDLKWSGTLKFGARTTTEETDLTTLNNLDISETLVFYENNGDTSKVYVCLRDDHYDGTMVTNDIVTSNSFKLIERI